MKSTFYFTLCSLFLCSVSSFAQEDPFGEEDPFEEAERNPQIRQVRIYTESYEVSAVEFAKLMNAPTNNNNHGKLRDSLLTKAKEKKGEVKLVSNHSLICRDGERASLESVDEFIYPTELPESDEEIFKGFGEDGGNIFPANPATPTAFETRNLGHTLEAEVIIGDDGKTIELRQDARTVKHVGDHVLLEWVAPYAKIKDAKPIFYTKRLKTTVTVQDGEFLLATTFSPDKDGKPDHSRKILYFVRAEILIVGGK